MRVPHCRRRGKSWRHVRADPSCCLLSTGSRRAQPLAKTELPDLLDERRARARHLARDAHQEDPGVRSWPTAERDGCRSRGGNMTDLRERDAMICRACGNEERASEG